MAKKSKGIKEDTVTITNPMQIFKNIADKISKMDETMDGFIGSKIAHTEEISDLSDRLNTLEEQCSGFKRSLIKLQNIKRR